MSKVLKNVTVDGIRYKSYHTKSGGGELAGPRKGEDAFEDVIWPAVLASGNKENLTKDEAERKYRKALTSVTEEK